jgi:outer membrane receptor protein involved in Fe transport
MTFASRISFLVRRNGLLTVFLMFVVCLPVFSQANLGRILGSVTDQTGGAIVGSIVTIVDVERGVSRALNADQAGEFNAPNLTPGNYTVRAEAKGFKTVERSGVLLGVGQEIRVDLTMQPGEQTEKITVTEALPMVETTSATLSGTLTNQLIVDIPLNGRDYVNLLPLQPGMIVSLGGGTYTRSANGVRTDDIGYLIDGLSGDEAYTGQSVLNAPIAAGDTSTSLPIDAIQEFNTEQNPKAEFGWKPGAIVNAGLKSGTNTIHGSAFAFGRDTALDARNFFNYPSQPVCSSLPAVCNKTPIGLEQFGGSVGGPIVKDKLFYFLNYEGQRYSVGIATPGTTPVTCGFGDAGCGLTAANPTISLVDACRAISFAKVTALSAQLAGLNADCSVKPTSYTPGPSESLFPQNTTSNGNIVLGLISTNQQDNGIGKVDYHINDHHSLRGMYFKGQGGGIWNDSPSEVGIQGSSNSPFMSSLFGYIQLGSAGWTWTPNSSWVNETRAGYTYYRQVYLSVDSTVNPLAYGVNSGVTNPQYFGLTDITINGIGGRLGGGWPKIKGPTDSLQLLDHVSYLRGRHAFKFGGEAILNTAKVLNTSNAKGNIQFRATTGPTVTALENFLEGNAANSGALSKILVGDVTRNLSSDNYAVFVQDDWRATQRLTVNLGMRYELYGVLRERNNLLANFDPVQGPIQLGTSALPHLYNGDHNNFSPRLGFAWDISGNGKTVVRAGASLMYEELPMAEFIDVSNALGLGLTPTGTARVVCSTNPCTAASKQVITQGTGNIAILTANVPGSSGLSANWKAQTAACVSGGTTACGSIFPSSIFALQCGDGLSGGAGPSAFNDPSPCIMSAVDPKMRTPYITTFSLNVERAITTNMSLEVGYVGTHGTKLLGFTNINQPPLGSGFSACSSPIVADCTTGALEQIARPYFSQFPYLSQIAELQNIDVSNYNALRIKFNQRPTHGLSFNVGYTYSHSLDDAAGNWSGNTMPLLSSAPQLQYGNSSFDIRQRFTWVTTYDLPSRKAPAQLLDGWSINSVVTLQGGTPWSPSETTDDFGGNGQTAETATSGQRWDFIGNPADFAADRTLASPSSQFPCWKGTSGSLGPSGCQLTSEPAACVNAAGPVGTPLRASLDSIGCFLSPNGNSVLIPPALGTVGTAARNMFRGPGYRNWDLSVLKNWKFKERFTTQFRAEFFNVLNHPAFANPNANPTGANFGAIESTPDQLGPNPVLGTGGARSIQLGLKVLW